MKHLAVPLKLLCCIALLCLFACSGVAVSQENTPKFSAPIDLAVTSQSIRATAPSNNAERWIKGGAIEFHARMYKGLGAVASVTGGHNDVSGDGFNMVTAVFGPRYTIDLLHDRVEVFGQGLVGIANLFGARRALDSSYPLGSYNSIAVQAGGGLDINLSHHFAVRAIQVDYLHTQLQDAHGNVQNMPRIGGGFVFRFGQSPRQ